MLISYSSRTETCTEVQLKSLELQVQVQVLSAHHLSPSPTPKNMDSSNTFSPSVNCELECHMSLLVDDTQRNAFNEADNNLTDLNCNECSQ